MTPGEKMKALRGEKSQQEVAKDLGISFSAYGKYERNERSPRDPLKKKIAKYFSTSVQDIFFDRTEHI
jgi:DNA-binding XRE family transcriptional regulator